MPIASTAARVGTLAQGGERPRLDDTDETRAKRNVAVSVFLVKQDVVTPAAAIAIEPAQLARLGKALRRIRRNKAWSRD